MKKFLSFKSGTYIVKSLVKNHIFLTNGLQSLNDIRATETRVSGNRRRNDCLVGLCEGNI